MSDISINHKTKLHVKPRMDQQLIGISDDCLIVQHFNINLALTMGWGTALFFWIIGLPMALYIAILPWIPPYGYNEDNSIATLTDLFYGMGVIGFLIYFFFFIFIGGGTMIAITLGVSYFNLRILKKVFSPVTFNRKTQMVSMYSLGKKEEVEWSKLSCTIVNIKYASGYVMHQSMVLQLNNVSKTGAKVQIEGSLLINALDDGDHDGTEGNWEYIRQYMEQGPEHLTLAPAPVIGLNHLDKQPMYSYNVTDSLRGNWFWPIIKGKDQHKIRIVVSYIYWPIKVAFFIPNLLTDWLWRRMCLRNLKDSKATPQYSLKNCGKQILTTNDAEKVSTIEEASAGNDLSYAEIKKRLKATTTEIAKPNHPPLFLALLISVAINVFFYYLIFDEALGHFLFGWLLAYIFE